MENQAKLVRAKAKVVARTFEAYNRFEDAKASGPLWGPALEAQANAWANLARLSQNHVNRLSAKLEA